MEHLTGDLRVVSQPIQQRHAALGQCLGQQPAEAPSILLAADIARTERCNLQNLQSSALSELLVSLGRIHDHGKANRLPITCSSQHRHAWYLQDARMESLMY